MPNNNRNNARRLLMLLVVAAAAAGCDGAFQVNNPNQLVEQDLGRPEAATALVNGAQASLARALGQLVLPLSVASDELRAIGSLDFGRQLDQGTLSNPANDVTNSAFPFVAEARFMVDEAISRLQAFDADGKLRTRADLARAYLYGGIVYTAIADSYDDFVISNRREAAPPIGEANMGALYDRAVEYLDRGLATARAAGSADLELAILAQRARTRHARAVWRLLNPRGTTPASPLVSDAEAVADAEAALRLIPAPDWKLQLRFSAGTVTSNLASQVNVRQEYRVGDAYIVPTADNKRVAAIRLEDPVENRPDAALRAAVNAFVSGAEYSPLTVLSARELRLILAEAALAAGREAEAARWINEVRSLDGRAPYQGQLSLVDLLVHERRVNLFLQGRRLTDQYRFGIKDVVWHASSDAARAPGTFLPIAEVERLSNCHLAGGC